MMLAKAESNPSFDSLDLAQHNMHKSLVLPEKLYSHDLETEQTFQAFEKACAGSFELAFITGSYSE